MVALIEGFPDHRQELAAPGDDHPGTLKLFFRARRGMNERVNDRRHPGKNRNLVLTGKCEIPVELEPFHHHIGTPGPDGGNSPRQPDMAHGIDTKVNIRWS